MLPLGTVLPSFNLAKVEGGSWSSDGLADQPLLVLFICAHCPYVKHVEPALSALERDWADRLQIVAISSNSVRSHPQDAPPQLLAQKQRNGWGFPYLHDHDQAVARSFQAACTPDPSLFDGKRRLVYRGQLDFSRPGRGPSDCADIRQALQSLLAGQPIGAPQKPAMGCSIKWDERCV
jgi:thiol-disulfide isomerase/thioredoxin